MARKKVGVQVDEDLWNEFNQFVKNKHGQTRGVLGSELDEALKNHINQSKTIVTTTNNPSVTDQPYLIENPNAHTHTSETTKNEKLIVDFTNEFRGKNKISHKELELFIIATEDVDHPQTIKSRIKRLESHGLIKGDGNDYENLSELSEDTIIITEDNYNVVLSYFNENFYDDELNEINKIDLKDVKKLPENIQDALTGITDYDKFNEFVK